MHIYVRFICISLMTNDSEHLFLYLLAICISLEICLFMSFAHCLSWVVFLLFCFYIFWILAHQQIQDRKIFSPILQVVFFFYFLSSFNAEKLLILIKSNLSIFPFIICTFGVIFKKPLPNLRSCSLQLCFLLGLL